MTSAERDVGLPDSARVLRNRTLCLKRFLFKHIYNHPAITEDRDRSVRCLDELFVYYLDAPGSMPASHEESARSEPRHAVVCDYIAGMTDQFLLRKYQEHFGASGSSAGGLSSGV